MAIGNAVSIGNFLRSEFLDIFIFIDKLHILYHPSSNLSNQIKIIIRNEILGDHERNVSKNWRKLGNFFVFCSKLQLALYPWVFRPQQAYVWKIHGNDSQSLKTKAEGPAVVAF